MSPVTSLGLYSLSLFGDVEFPTLSFLLGTRPGPLDEGGSFLGQSPSPLLSPLRGVDFCSGDGDSTVTPSSPLPL